MSSLPIILSPILHLSKVQQELCTMTRTLQPPMSMLELTIKLPKFCQESDILITCVHI